MPDVLPPTSLDMLDADENAPAAPGWYAANWCYDVEDGVGYSALFWTGDEWRWEPNLKPVLPPPVGAFHPDRCESKVAADKLADELDPNG